MYSLPENHRPIHKTHLLNKMECTLPCDVATSLSTGKSSPADIINNIIEIRFILPSSSSVTDNLEQKVHHDYRRHELLAIDFHSENVIQTNSKSRTDLKIANNRHVKRHSTPKFTHQVLQSGT